MPGTATGVDVGDQGVQDPKHPVFGLTPRRSSEMTRLILVQQNVREPYRCGDTQGSAFLPEVFRPALGCERGVIKLVPAGLA